MPVRLYKLVVPFEEIPAFAKFSGDVVKPGFLEFVVEGGVRFYQSSNSPSTFFLTAGWNSVDAAKRFDSSAIGRIMTKGVTNFLSQRLTQWDLVVVTNFRQNFARIRGREGVFIRLMKVSVNRDQEPEVVKLFSEYVGKIVIEQPGCLDAKLLRCKKSANLYFTYSVWADKQDFVNFMKADGYRDYKANAPDFLEDRIEMWNLTEKLTAAEIYLLDENTVK